MPDWGTYETHILSELISRHRAHGTKSPVLRIDMPTLVLSVHGMRIDVIEACSQPLAEREFHLDSSGRALTIETLWHDICGKDGFDLKESYISGESALFAYTQTLSNGCVETSLQEARPYHEVPKSEWLTQGAAYLTEALGQSDVVLSELSKIAADGDHLKWSRAANGASSHLALAFTRTAKAISSWPRRCWRW
jgi:hypothetical protein